MNSKAGQLTSPFSPSILRPNRQPPALFKYCNGRGERRMNLIRGGGQRRQRLAGAIFHADGAGGYRSSGTIQNALNNKPTPPTLLRRCGRDVLPAGAVALQDWRGARGFYWPNLKKYNRALVVCMILRCWEGEIKNLANSRVLPGGGGMP